MNIEKVVPDATWMFELSHKEVEVIAQCVCKGIIPQFYVSPADLELGRAFLNTLIEKEGIYV